MTAEIADLGLAVQSAWNTPASTPSHRVALAAGTVNALPTISRNDEDVRGRSSRTSIMSALAFGGTVEFFARPAMLGLLLYAALGTKTAAGSGDPYTHVFAGPSDTDGAGGQGFSTLPYLTVWRNVGGALFEQFNDCKVATLEVVSRAGQPIRVRAAIVAGVSKSRTSSVGGATIEGGLPFHHAHGRGSLKFEGAVASAVDEWTLRVDNGSTAFVAADGTIIVDEGQADVTLTAGQIVASPGLWNRLHYGVDSPADALAHVSTVQSLSGGADLLLTMSASRTLRLVLPRLELLAVDGWTPHAAGGAIRRLVTYRAGPRPLGPSLLSLKGLWRFDETSGTSAAEALIGGPAGTYTGTYYLGVPALAPDGGSAFESPSAAGYVTVPGTALNVGDVFTAIAWVDLASTATDQWIVAQGTNGLGLVRTAGAGALEFRKAGVSTLTTSTIPVTTTGIYHVAAVKNGAVVKLYVNGVDATGAVTNATIAGGTQALTWGRYLAGTGMTGVLDNAKLYGRALSQAEVVADMVADQARVTATLLNSVSGY